MSEKAFIQQEARVGLMKEKIVDFGAKIVTKMLLNLLVAVFSSALCIVLHTKQSPQRCSCRHYSLICFCLQIDVYSFGVLLCEMCIQKMPDLDRRDTQVGLVENPVIQALIRRCLQSVAEDRPNMEEIIEELEQLSGTS